MLFLKKENQILKENDKSKCYRSWYNGYGNCTNSATKGHKVCLYDNYDGAIENANKKIKKILNRLVEKKRITDLEKKEIINRIHFSTKLDEIQKSNIVIEAIIENIKIKKDIFSKIEEIVDKDCILASNTSSLSIASIASACEHAERVIGIHFFNPAPLMPLVEIIPAIQTSENTLIEAKKIIDGWGKGWCHNERYSRLYC